jgi:hypothetical protein
MLDFLDFLDFDAHLLYKTMTRRLYTSDYSKYLYNYKHFLLGNTFAI